jgi:hypothetical protein
VERVVGLCQLEILFVPASGAIGADFPFFGGIPDSLDPFFLNHGVHRIVRLEHANKKC